MGREPGWYLFLGWLFTFQVVVFSRVLFRGGDLETAGLFYSRVITWAPGTNSIDAYVVAASVAGFALNFVGRRIRNGFIWVHEKTPEKWAPILWLAIGIFLLALQPGDVAPYIYFQF
jgi:hypothetical protein